MMVNDKVQELGAANTLHVYGVHAFEVLAGKIEPDEQVRWIRLSRAGWTPCLDVEEAPGLLETFLEVWGDEDGRTHSQLPGGFGFVADVKGELRFVVSTNGNMRAIRYLGKVGEVLSSKQAKMSLFSLERDETDEGEAFDPCGADFWAMGRPT
jgi:hypothetical protein